ncbi:MAG TPA: hypothetical protein VK419_12705, partial [Bryobacteraceae bacterium]|nr:hypothetical protein [Bryobacteraceae bacterium]
MTTFDFLKLRFHVAARQRIAFPAAAANVLRGGFGSSFKKIACVPDCAGAKACPRRQSCAYAKFFAPESTTGPSGLRDLPRPFVFRASHLNHLVMEPGQKFYFDMNVFAIREDVMDLFARAFAERFGAIERMEGREPVRLPLDPNTAPSGRVGAIRVRFLTPTELKGADRPE